MKKIVISLITTCIILFGFSGVTSAASTTYKVKKGDTLWKIATKHKVSVNQLKSWNGLKKDLIKPNQVLKVSKPTVKKATKAKAATNKKQTTAKKASKNPAYKTMTVRATAYTAGCKGCSGITATGINLKKNPNAKVISVDPKQIPLGSKVWVEGYGEAIAGDTGGAMKGNKIDLHMPTKKKALNWGVRTVKIKVYQ